MPGRAAGRSPRFGYTSSDAKKMSWYVGFSHRAVSTPASSKPEYHASKDMSKQHSRECSHPEPPPPPPTPHPDTLPTAQLPPPTCWRCIAAIKALRRTRLLLLPLLRLSIRLTKCSRAPATSPAAASAAAASAASAASSRRCMSATRACWRTSWQDKSLET